MVENAALPDAHEGIAAFLEKRAAMAQLITIVRSAPCMCCCVSVPHTCARHAHAGMPV